MTDTNAASAISKDSLAKIQSCLGKIQFYASWDGTSGDSNTQSLAKQCLALDPDAQPRIDQAIEKGRGDSRLLAPFYEYGQRYGNNFAARSDVKRALDELKQIRPGLLDRAKQQATKGAAAADRRHDAKSRRATGEPVSKVRRPGVIAAPTTAPALAPTQTKRPAGALPTGLHPCDLRTLAPQPAWQLLIDETGSQFGIKANEMATSDRTLGRMLGLLIPQQGHRLPPLKSGWHAVDQTIGAIDRTIQAVLDASVGVLGITVQQLPDAPGERWAFCVIRLLDLVLRLLPVNAPTCVEVLIEERGDDFKRGNQWPAVAEQVRLRLADAYPERGRLIELKIRTIGKTDSPFNGYVDALAFIASGGGEHSRACLAASGLDGTCLLKIDAETLTRTLEWLDRGHSLEGRDWSLLLAHPDAEQPANLISTLLNRLGEAAQSDANLWRRYLDHVMGHFDSRSLDLRVLNRQVIWLQRWAPEDQRLPPTLRLLWLTAQLARANHLGQSEQPWLDEMQDLADRLMDEDARLVCRAELNLAVTATNRYDFAQAGRALQRWNPPEPLPVGKLNGLLQRLLGGSPLPTVDAVAAPKASAGLRYWGQVRSSLGQHAAFLDDPTTAVRFFDEALASFAQLSDPEQERRESRQTRTYRAIALMDDPVQDADRVREAVEMVIGKTPGALTALAQSTNSADKYAHHLALRWLVHRPDAGLAAVYLAQREAWDQGTEHPWPLIELYRGILLHPQDAQTARELALDGFTLAFADDSGPVVRLIGACCRTVAAAWGAPWPEAEPVLAQLEQDLPLAADRIARIRAELTQPGDPLALLRAVLPFNFR